MSNQDQAKNERSVKMQEVDGVKFTRKKAVTLPTMSFKGVDTRLVKFLGKIYKGEPIQGKDGKTQEPADLAHVIDLTTGEERTLICGTLLSKNLEKHGDYVGKCYEITEKPLDGKRYKDCQIFEIVVG